MTSSKISVTYQECVREMVRESGICKEDLKYGMDDEDVAHECNNYVFVRDLFKVSDTKLIRDIRQSINNR